jgi:hypothetical protein
MNDRYYCLQQNPIVLAWIIFLKKSSLDLVYRPYPRKILHKILFLLQRKWRTFRRNFLLYLALIRYKYLQKISKSTLTLPIYGQIGKVAHQGYKIFDFRRRVVTKVFDHNVDRDRVLKEIEKLKIVSQIDFAPSLRRWNIEERWYEEEYIEGYLDVDHSYKPVDNSVTVANKFHHIITPCIEKLILLQSPMTVNVTEYANDLREMFESSRILRQGFKKVDKKEIDGIKEFFHSTIEQLNAEQSGSFYLVFTHGDFCSANILNTKDRIKIIDWGNATYRSALFDFYSYFFYRPYRGKISVSEVVSEINEALPFFISKLSLKAPDISKSLLSLEKVYRWFYYIEAVYLDVEREMTDTNLDIMESILRYIEVFDRYEGIVSTTIDNLKEKIIL